MKLSLTLEQIRCCAECGKELDPSRKRWVIGDAHFHKGCLIDRLIKTGGRIMGFLDFRPGEESQ